ncbi:MAG: CMP deaminase [Parcubacteria group bacterium]|nr:CMP deaminase [Parcubacteria group bacterium]
MKSNIKELLRLAYEAAKTSPDPSTKNCALIIHRKDDIKIADVNRFPDGVVGRPERLIKPLKYEYIEHAERMALFSAARDGISTKRCSMVVTMFPCARCAHGIIQSGIVEIMTHKQAYDRRPESWKQSMEDARIMFVEAGVRIVFFDGKVGVEGALLNGERWNP